MARRLFDMFCAALGLLLTAPLIAIAMIGIRLTSPGPVLYRAARVGRNGRPFTMAKLRTMHATGGGSQSRVTAIDDDRIFPFGDFLRKTKIDELPQLVNVLRGEMSIIGPRPEDPYFVSRYYGPEHRETLSMRPGLASPGSLYHDTHGKGVVTSRDPETSYLAHLLPLKLALDLVYVRRASLAYDCRLIGRTIRVIAGAMLGQTRFPDPPELPVARAWVTPLRDAVPVEPGLADAPVAQRTMIRPLPVATRTEPRANA